MSKRTVLADVSGWTPVIDGLADELGTMTALVFGVIWRHCQMRDGVCTASQETLAKKIGTSRRSIIRHAQTLVDNGYLLAQYNEGLPVIYQDTGKANLRLSVTGGVTQSHRGVTEIDMGCDTESQGGVTESHTRKQSSKQVKKQSSKQIVIKHIEHFQNDDFNAAWDAFLKMRAEIKHPMTQTSCDRIITLLERHDLPTAIGMLWRSVENNWRGVFPPNNQNGKQMDRSYPEGV